MWFAIFAVTVVLLGGTLGAGRIRRMAFGQRTEGNEHVRYYNEEDFPGLNKEEIHFSTKDGITLRGGLFSCAPRAQWKGLVIFVHGMGGGYLSYTTEIHHFAKAGYGVLAYDGTGTMSSDGKNLVGMHRCIQDLDDALTYVEKRADLTDLQRLVVGHSRGAFAACNVFHTEHRVQGVVSLSSFDSYPRAVCDIAAGNGGHIRWMSPFLFLDEWIKFGRIGTYTAALALHRRHCPVLVLHGERDDAVPLSNSVAIKVKGWSNRDNPITVGIYSDKFHNVYNSSCGESALRTFVSRRDEMRKAYHGEVPPQVKDAFYEGLDFETMTEEDPRVMERIDAFMDQCIKGGEMIGQ